MFRVLALAADALPISPYAVRRKPLAPVLIAEDPLTVRARIISPGTKTPATYA